MVRGTRGQGDHQLRRERGPHPGADRRDERSRRLSAERSGRASRGDGRRVAQIIAGIERGLSRGAVAVGFGIAYTPEAEGWEIVEAFKVAARFNASAHVHIRGGDAAAGFMEVVAAATIAGAPLHVVHVQSSGGAQTARLLSLIADARAHGVDVTTEMYPYTAGQTRIESALFDGWEQYPDGRFQTYLWPATGERLTRETFAKYRKTGGPIIMFSNTEEVVRGAAASPLTMIASDGGQTPTHPRTAGTFSRILGPYVRESKALTLMDALRKMTLMPAQRLERRVPSMKNKGRIRVGADADLTAFDSQRIADQSTYEQPARSSIGVKYVLVNGVVVVRNGQVEAGSAPGRAVRAPCNEVTFPKPPRPRFLPARSGFLVYLPPSSSASWNAMARTNRQAVKRLAMSTAIVAVTFAIAQCGGSNTGPRAAGTRLRACPASC